MKKYVPMKMIGKSRFVNYYNSWQEEDKAALLGRMERLISENREYADKKNYGHLCNLITSLAMVMILEEKGHAREEFLYTQQIGTGGSMCDYTSKRDSGRARELGLDILPTSCYDMGLERTN